MSLAANDAFSFALPHNGPRRRSLTRSPSPITNVGLFSQSQSAKGIQNIRRHVIRRLSNLQPVPAEVVDDVQDLHGFQPRRSRKDMNHAKQPQISSRIYFLNLLRQWEVPRKTMHSSIGKVTLHFHLHDFHPFTVF